jgi:regulatory protein
LEEPENLENKAIDVALKFVSYQPRSIFETAQKLKQKGFPAEIRSLTVDKLVRAGYLDDYLFAKSYLNEAESKNYGLQRIRQTLFKKGIGRETIDKILEDYDFDDEFERAEIIAGSRFKKLKDLEPEKQYRRLMSFLIRRGYKASIAIQISNRLIKGSSEHTD